MAPSKIVTPRTPLAPPLCRAIGSWIGWQLAAERPEDLRQDRKNFARTRTNLSVRGLNFRSHWLGKSYEAQSLARRRRVRRGVRLAITHTSQPVPDVSAMSVTDLESPVAQACVGSTQTGVAGAPTKRLFDVIAASLALLLFLPMLLLIAGAVRLDSRGPALYRQARTGLHGRSFLILKFRTMRNVETGDEIFQARVRDPRVTRLGHILRRTSLDELPQLMNVIRGEMSLVGPRPHAVCHDDTWATLIPEYSRRYSVRPGLTGLAQVSGFRGEIRDPSCLRCRIDADIEYIRSWSFWGDVAIILRTVFLVGGDPAAY